MRLLFACLLCLSFAARTEAAPVPPPPPAPDDAAPSEKAPARIALPLRARLDRDTIRAAIESPARAGSPPSGDVLSADPYRKFSREFTQARKPSCMGPDALKHQPPVVSTKNWNVGVGGLVALPFWAAAIARGKCR